MIKFICSIRPPSADPLHLERKWPSQFLFIKIWDVTKQTLTVQIYFVHHFIIAQPIL